MFDWEFLARPVLVPFRALSAAGFWVSCALHIAGWLGYWPGGWVWGMHMGIFVVFVPAILLMTRASRYVPSAEIWKAVLQGCPLWLQRLTKIVFVYALINFVLFALTSDGSDAARLRGFSGHWMAFYLASFAIIESALRSPSLSWAVRCPNGHSVSRLHPYCPECGSPVTNQN